VIKADEKRTFVMSKAGVIGGVCTTHAPQLWTLPDSEDPNVVKRVKELLGGVGDKLKAMKPDICIVIANDHAHQFLLHCTASFTMHIGGIAEGSFAGRDYQYPVASQASLDLLRYAQRNNVDPAFTSNAKIDYAFGIPLDFTGIDSIPILPIFVNAYVPPQPSIERCFAFGRILGDGIKALGLRAVVVCSGGLSHYPGTERYMDPGPDEEFDRHFMSMMERGELRYLLALDEKKLDETGNIELRCWGVAAGMIGERAPDVTNFEPTWHHNYGTVAWTTEPEEESFEPHYPSIHPDRVVLSETLHNLAGDKAERNKYLANPVAYAASIAGLRDEERKALVALDQREMIALGMHPFVPHTFRRVLERAGILEAAAPPKK
jgi:2,3-dihydroxyphenylpropionate 1,2-dioxygenase